ncbi:hypothetical protein E4T39_08809 [Aureobasidium subglaciale]|nr:hypothetical protein E4T39_08809 [Aureobasidium subglaciale]
MAPSVLIDTYESQAILVSWAETRAFAQNPSTVSVVLLICVYSFLTGGAMVHHLVADSPLIDPSQALMMSSPVICAGELLIMIYYWLRYGFTDLRFRGASKLLVADFEATENHLASSYKHLRDPKAWLSIAKRVCQSPMAHILGCWIVGARLRLPLAPLSGSDTRRLQRPPISTT